MPELPDVQVFKEEVDARALGAPIEHVYVNGDGVLRGSSASTLRRHLKGHRLERTRRHGKHLFAGTDEGGWLHLHFGMTGRPEQWRGAPEGPDPDHTRLRLDFRGGTHLAYVDLRRLGEIAWLHEPERWVEEQGLGPDALDPSLDAEALAERLAGRSGSIKSALMDQSVVAGIGNVYSDEILFQARAHPARPVDQTLERPGAEALHRELRRVLEAAVRARVSDFPDWFLLPHRHEQGVCPRCGTRLARVRIAGRTSWYCPKDQPRSGTGARREPGGRAPRARS